MAENMAWSLHDGGSFKMKEDGPMKPVLAKVNTFKMNGQMD